MSKVMRKLSVFGSPLFVGAVNLFHPIVHAEAPGSIYEGIDPHAGWWIVLQMLNLFGFALLGLAAFLLLGTIQGKAAGVARITLAIFVPTYIGFDSLIGIGTGTLVQHAQALPIPQLHVMKAALDAYWNGSAATALAIAGSVSWGIGMSASAVAFTKTRQSAVALIGVIAGAFTGWGYATSSYGSLPWWIGIVMIGVVAALLAHPSLPVSLLVLSGILFGTTHVVPYGPLGMACFLAVAYKLYFVAERVQTEHTSLSSTNTRGEPISQPGA